MANIKSNSGDTSGLRPKQSYVSVQDFVHDVMHRRTARETNFVNPQRLKPGEIIGPLLLNEPRLPDRALVNHAAARIALAGSIAEQALQEALLLTKNNVTFARLVSYLISGELVARENPEVPILQASETLQKAAGQPEIYPELAVNIHLLRTETD